MEIIRIGSPPSGKGIHDTYQSQAWMVGRVTMEKDFTKGHRPSPANKDRLECL
jgi:hypothetical protein